MTDPQTTPFFYFLVKIKMRSSITAMEWREMTTIDILVSIDIAIRVLLMERERKKDVEDNRTPIIRTAISMLELLVQ
jgi:hypothetical protein